MSTFSTDASSSTRSTTTPKFPKRIILLRHGESLGNVDENLYAEIPDWKIPLTRRGERQSLKAAQDLHQLLKNESVFCYCSPYNRTQETWKIISEHLQQQGDVDLIGTREEPRIAEQQFGNFQNPRKVRTAKMERRTFGRFFFRFPNGEAGLDVYNRVSSFLATLSRDLLQFQDFGANLRELNIVIVTHGLTLRLLLMRYFQLSVEEFEHSYNPQNAKLVVMERIDPEDIVVVEQEETDGNTERIETHHHSPRKKAFFRLEEQAKEALNLSGDVSSEKPVFFRGDALDQIPYDLEEEI